MVFSIEQADNAEWVTWWAAYRNINEDFSQSFDEIAADLAGVPFCHWISQNGRRIGGLILLKDRIGDLFFIPPFEDYVTALQSIVPNEVRKAENIAARYINGLNQIGFAVDETRLWMLRPTQSFDSDIGYQQTRPAAEYADDISKLMFAAFKGSTGEYGKRSVESHLQSINNYHESVRTSEPCYRAGSLLWENDQLISACLVQPYKSFASIRFIATHPKYQRQGIGTYLIQYAIDALRTDYKYVVLAVTVGNPAQALYSRLGFISADTTSTLLREE